MALDPTAGGRFPSTKSNSDNNKKNEHGDAGISTHDASNGAFGSNNGTTDFGSGKSFVVGETRADFGSGKSFVSDDKDSVSGSNSNSGVDVRQERERAKQKLDDIKRDKELTDFARKAELDKKMEIAKAELERTLKGILGAGLIVVMVALMFILGFVIIHSNDADDSNDSNDVVMTENVNYDGLKSNEGDEESDEAADSEAGLVGAVDGLEGENGVADEGENAVASQSIKLGQERLSGYLVPSSDGHYIVPVGDDMVAMHIVTTDKMEFEVITCLCSYGEHDESDITPRSFGYDPIMNGISFVQCEEGALPCASIWMSSYVRFRTTQTHVANVFVQACITQEDLDYLIETCGEEPATQGRQGSVQRLGYASDDTLDWLEARGANFGFLRESVAN